MESYGFNSNSNSLYERKITTRNNMRPSLTSNRQYAVVPLRTSLQAVKEEISQEHTYAKPNEVPNGYIEEEIVEDYQEEYHDAPSTSAQIDVGSNKNFHPLNGNRVQGKRTVKAPMRFTENDNKQGELKVHKIGAIKEEKNETSSSSPGSSDSSEYEEDSDSDTGEPRRRLKKRNFQRQNFSEEEEEDEPIEVQGIEEEGSKGKKRNHFHHNFQHQLLTCAVCDRKVVMRSNARTSKITNALTHAKMHLTKRQFECSVCRYQSNTHIQRHVQSIHGGRAKIIDKMNDELRKLYRDMTIRCFPHLYKEIHSWYRQSSDQTRAGGRKSRNMIKLEKEDDCEIEC
ncbi:unnamed protein product, partial [Mesorhabditis belari]|uniref:C2H2-type domain-containing protein n=1 Tax=Mesorhabditis belari TaxID=2138241 RepID=A0AAF3FK61_9BILA